MSKITLQGTIIDALPMEQGISQRTGNQWMKQTFIIETSANPQFSTRVAVTSFKSELIEKFLGFPPGSAVEVDCYVESRESQSGRWFTEVTAADIRPLVRTQHTPQPQQPQYQPQKQPAPVQYQPQYQPSQQQFRAPQPQPAPAPQPQTNDQRFVQQYQQGMQQQYQPQQQQPAYDMKDLPF